MCITIIDAFFLSSVAWSGGGRVMPERFPAKTKIRTKSDPAKSLGGAAKNLTV